MAEVGPIDSERKLPQSVARLTGPAWCQAAAEKVDPHVAQVLSDTIGLDMHNHVYPADGTTSSVRPTQGDPPQGSEEQQQEPELFIADELL